MKGFTLIELMIVVAIIGILAGIALPQFSSTIRKSHEATTKGNLGALRSALSIYYADTEGRYPEDNLQSIVTGSKYLRAIPMKYTPPYHPKGDDVGVYNDFSAMDAAREDWFYVGGSGANEYGNIVVNCVHLDLRGTKWSAN